MNGQSLTPAKENLNKVGISSAVLDSRSQVNCLAVKEQRIAIARALFYLIPELILFDEPTSALDPKWLVKFWKTMKDLAKSGLTMIIVDFMKNGICA